MRASVQKGISRRLAENVCHGRPRRAMEPLRPQVALLRAVAWLAVSLGLALLAASVILLAVELDDAAYIVTLSGLYSAIGGMGARSVAMSLRPNDVGPRRAERQ
jgi:uncharacterized membrane protein YccC